MKTFLLRLLKGIAIGVGVIVGVVALMQLIPFGREHSDPAVTVEPKWDQPRTRELAVRACFDCHSNETKWPWYSNVAPLSWVMQHDVEVGRSVLNFSEWDRPWDLAEQAGGDVIRRDMPPRSYRMLHEHARLTKDEVVELARGLHATLGLLWTIARR